MQMRSLAQGAIGCHLCRLFSRADVAQLVEQLIRNQQVTSSSLVIGSTFNGFFDGVLPDLHFDKMLDAVVHQGDRAPGQSLSVER
jgi:hypothetical protein